MEERRKLALGQAGQGSSVPLGTNMLLMTPEGSEKPPPQETKTRAQTCQGIVLFSFGTWEKLVHGLIYGMVRKAKKHYDKTMDLNQAGTLGLLRKWCQQQRVGLKGEVGTGQGHVRAATVYSHHTWLKEV